MDMLLVVLRWMHVMSAMVLVGGTIYMACVLYPSLASLTRDEVERLGGLFRQRWSRLVMLSILLLLVSGIVNVILMASRGEFGQVPGYYHGMLGVKILLALVVFLLLSLLSGRSAVAVRLRANPSRWLAIVVLLSLLVVGIAGVMKLAPRSDEVMDNPSTTSAAPNSRY